MNKFCYKLIFSQRLGMLIPIAEIAKSHLSAAGVTKRCVWMDAENTQSFDRKPIWRIGAGYLALVMTGWLAVQPLQTWALDTGALPTDGNIVSGAGSINVTGHNMNINTTTDKSIIQWNSFNVGANAAVNFNMPSSTASVLNHVMGNTASQIYGSINANGHVYIVNQNGIVFGNGAQVNVNSLTATTLDTGIESLYSNGIMSDTTQPSFAGLVGSINVESGASINAATGGRVMLLAPDVTNSGVITAPDGQVILAAGKSIYLSSTDGFAGLLVEVTSGGTAKNIGDIIVGSGNASLIGLAVNQDGRISASTTVRSNGTIYLKAKEITQYNSPATDVYGAVTLGKNSQTNVQIAVNDSETVANAQSIAKSEIDITGQNIDIEGSIVANSGVVNISGTTNTGTSAVFLGDTASIDVSGVDATAPMSRNQLAIQLYSQQLNDSPILRGGALFGQTLYLDARKGTSIISQSVINDALQSQQRTIAERMTDGGTVSLLGDSVISKAGSSINIANGVTHYAAGTIVESNLFYNGVWVNASDAKAGVPYSGINSQYSITDARWGVTRTWQLNSSTAGQYQPAYDEGGSAGTVDVTATNQMALQGGILSQTTAGIYQRGETANNAIPSGGTLNVTYSGAGTLTLTNSPSKLGDAFTSTSTLSANQQTNAELDTSMLAKGVNHLNVSATKALINVNSTLAAAAQGSIKIDGNGGVNVNSDISVAGGDITLGGSLAANVVLGAGVQLSTAGLYTNDLLGVSGAMIAQVAPDAGNVTITDGLVMQQGAHIDASAGAWVQRNGTIQAGNAGNVEVTLAQNSLANGAITAYGVTTAQGTTNGGGLTVHLQDESGTSGVLNVQLGGSNPQLANTLWLPENFFTVGGLSSYTFDSSNSATGSMMIGDAANHATLIHPMQQTRYLSGSYRSAISGAGMANISTVTTLPDYARSPTALSLTAGNQLTLNSNAAIVTDAPIAVSGARGDVHLSSRGQMNILGDITAPAANINLSITRNFDLNGNPAQPNGVFDNTLSLFVGSQSVLSARGQYINPPVTNGTLRTAQVADAGNITLDTQNGVLILKEGSVLDVSAVSGKVDLPTAQGYSRQQVDGAAGTISLTGRDGLAIDGTLLGKASGQGAAGTLAVTLGGSTSVGTETINATTPLYFPNGQRVLTVTQEKQLLAANNTPGSNVSNLIDTSSATQPLTNATGVGQISAAQISAGGFDNVQLRVDNVDSASTTSMIAFQTGVNLVVPSTLTLDATAFSGGATLNAAQVSLQNIGGTNLTASNITAGNTPFTVNANFIDVIGNVAVNNVSSLHLNSATDIRLRGPATSLNANGALIAPETIAMDAAQVYPSTGTSFSISPVGTNTTIEISNNRHTASVMPLSAQGALTLTADDIIQAGTLRAPLGQISLNASHQLTLGTGSLTSVSAEGSLIPYAVTVLGGSQMTNAEGNLTTVLSALNAKKINLNANNIDMQANAKVDISGGGDTQAFEWIQGIGGSQDILNMAGYYAVLPSLGNQYAPYDYNMYGTSTAVYVGQAIHLSGGNGLAAGTYTLLPAHYALMPGAYLVKVDGTTLPLNTQLAQLDGSSLMSGYLTQLDGTSRGQYSSFNVMTGNIFYANAGTKDYKGAAEYAITYGNAFFTNLAQTNNTAVSSLSADAGQLTIAATNELNLNGNVIAKKATGAKGALVDISSSNIEIVSSLGAAQAGVLQLTADQLDRIEADSVLLGGTRVVNGNTQVITTQASSVVFANDASHAVTLGELIATATDTVQVNDGAVIQTAAVTSNPTTSSLQTSGAGALLAVSASHDFDYARTTPASTSGSVVIQSGAQVSASRSAVMDATFAADKSGNLTVAAGGSLTLGANQFVLGNSGSGTGTQIDEATLQSYGALNTFTFNSYQNLDVYGAVAFGNQQLNLTFNTSGIAHHGTGDVTITADTLTLKNTLGSAFNLPQDAGPSQLTFNTHQSVFGATINGQGFNIAGFDTVNVQASDQIIMRDSGQMNITAGQTLLDANVVTAGTGANYSLVASGHLQTNSTGSLQSPTTGMGATVNLTAQQTTLGGNIELLAGQLNVTSTQGDLVVASGADISTRSATEQFDGQYSNTTDAGNIQLTSNAANVVVQSNALLDVSGGATKGNAGRLTITAQQGQFIVADQTLKANAASGQSTGSFALDVHQLDNFSAVNTALETGHFNQSRDIRVRNGDVTIAGTDTVTAHTFTLGVDNGSVSVAGIINANGDQGGAVSIYANGQVGLTSTAQINAKGQAANQSTGDLQTGAGGQVLLSSNSTASINAVSAANGAVIDVSGYKAADHGQIGVDGAGGTVTLVGRRGTSGNDTANTVNVAFDTTSAIRGAAAVNVEGMRTYTASTFNSNISGLVADTNSFYNDAANTVASYQLTQDGLSAQVLPYVIVKSTNGATPTAMTITTDQNLRSFGGLLAGKGGTLALLSNGNLSLTGSLSDGFSTATSAGVLQSNTQTFSYQLVAGADYTAANPMETVAGVGNFSLGASKTIRTGTGDITIAAGGDINLASNATIYTIGQATTPLSGFTLPSAVATSRDANVINAASYVNGGGDISLVALGNITGSATTQSVNQWLLRQGGNGVDTSWWIRNDLFNQGVAALGGGNVFVGAQGNITNLSASSATNAQYDNAGTSPTGDYVVNGGGNVTVNSGGNITNGVYYVGRGQLNLHAADSIIKSSSTAMGTTLALQDASANVSAGQDVRIDTVFNPTLWTQGNTIGLLNSSASTFFDTYGTNSALVVSALTGNLSIGQQTKTSIPNTGLSSSGYASVTNNDLAAVHPGQVYATAYNGDMTVYKLVLSPSSQGQLSLLAQGSILGAAATSTTSTPVAQVLISDADLSSILNVNSPTTGSPSSQIISSVLGTIKFGVSTTPVHAGDSNPVVIVAKTGDVQMLGTPTATTASYIYGLQSAKPVYISAGNNVAMSASIQNNNQGDISIIKAGNDFVMQNGFQYATVNVNGPGDLMIEAGRNINLGNTSGIQSMANTVNPNLPTNGANITMLAGVGKTGADITDFVATYINPNGAGPTGVTGDALSNYRSTVNAMVQDYMQKRTGQSLTVDEALQQYLALDTTQQAPLAYAVYSKEMVFAIKDYVLTKQTTQGDAVIASLFPATNYAGDILMYQSQVRTARDANINIMVPGGLLNAGVASTSDLVHDIGIVTERGGSISVYADKGFQVNQSKVATLFGGDLSAWVSQGDVDAGRGSKTAVSVPQRVVSVDNNGNVTLEVKGAATGSGLSTSTYDPDGPNGPLTAPAAGNVYLAAPRGVLNAGEAGIKSGGNIYVGAPTIVNSTNISAAGSSNGVPAANTGSLAAATAGTTNTSAGNANSMTDGLSNQLAKQDLAPKTLPPIVNVKTIRLED